MCVYASIADLYETFRTNQSLSASLNCKNWMQSEDNSERTEFLCRSLSCSMWFKRAGANSLKCFINGFISYKTNAKTILQQHNIGQHELSLWESLLSLLLKDNSITNLHYKVIKTHNEMCFGVIKGHRKETIA